MIKLFAMNKRCSITVILFVFLFISEYNTSAQQRFQNVNRNAKRSRLTALIKERADKNKIVVTKKEPPPEEVTKAVFKFESIVLAIPVDPRYNYSRIILDALNSCESSEMTSVFRKYCSKDVHAIHEYTGSDEFNALGPGIKHTEIFGVESCIDMWSTWFKYSPDSIYVYNNTTGSLNVENGTSMNLLPFVYVVDSQYRQALSLPPPHT